MKPDVQAIKEKALLHLSKVLGIPLDSLDGEMRFEDVKARPISFFNRNELDIILDDVHDVASKKTHKKLVNGEIEIVTINDYVNYMAACYLESPEMVMSVLRD